MAYNLVVRTEFIARITERERLVEIEPRRSLVVAIEGPVCAGKSTLVENLNQDGLGTILEYSEYVAHANQDFPKFPPADEEAAKKSFEFFLNLERRRSQDMAELTQNKIAIDRSVFTLLAFELGAAKITGIDISDWAVERLSKENDLIAPDYVFYLDVPVAISSQRAERNGIPIPAFLLSEKFNQGFRDFFVGLEQTMPGYITFVSAQKESDEVFAGLQEGLRVLGK